MSNDITCVILAGGLARRMGNADKAFVALNGQPLLSHVINRITPQVSRVIINANGDPARFAPWNLPVIADTIADFPGPLAGVLAAMEWVRDHQPQSQWVVSIPVDTPFAPLDLVERLSQSITDEAVDMACAKSNDRAHPVVGLWPVRLADKLRQAMVKDSIRKVDLWTAQYKLAQSEFDTNPIDPFFNINRPQDVEQAEKILREVA